MSRLDASPLLRRVLLPAFERLNPGDVTIRNHHTGDPMTIHSYRHKGYWFHGAKREAATLAMLRRLIGAGDQVLEAGGHIGYVTLFLADLVGPGGGVVVFEPGPGNLAYLRPNVASRPNVRVVAAAVSDHNGIADFYVENLSGQNNSLVEDFAVFEEVKRSAHSVERYEKIQVPVVTLSDWCQNEQFVPDWLKIDIEGAEYEALEGAAELLDLHTPGMMIEVTLNQQAVQDRLQARGYAFFSPTGQHLPRLDDFRGNLFALHNDKHHKQISGISVR
jgi:FkbM family methyltransferase